MGSKNPQGNFVGVFEELGRFSRAAVEEEQPLQDENVAWESQERKGDLEALLPFSNYPSCSNKDTASPHSPSRSNLALGKGISQQGREITAAEPRDFPPATLNRAALLRREDKAQMVLVLFESLFIA